MITAILIMLLCTMYIHCQNLNGTISCLHSGYAHSCASASCPVVDEVFRKYVYVSDCYVIGTPTTRGERTSATWYHFYLTNGRAAYVSGLICAGAVERCPRSHTPRPMP
ncbi:unnamed protein product [Adineta ricciae]|uniref:Uncharacterized protein n=1 Tax=Adineta ricciae TaxID=249248 RepID=A0A813ST53_ADIRI|nr:unnamed protein product [Adineta ricciae]CAF1543619.1 unnamed protein product [Adineta ricciae]